MLFILIQTLMNLIYKIGKEFFQDMTDYLTMNTMLKDVEK